jgi:hypothetical protein
LSDTRTRKGKVADLQELGITVDQELDQWRSKIHYTEMIDQVQGEMYPTRSSADNSVAEQRMREIRDWLRALDPIEKEAALMEAANSGNALFLEAVENSPVPFQFSTRELVQKVRLTQLEKQYPTEATHLQDLRTAQEQLDSALKSVRVELRKAGLNATSSDLSAS